MRIALLFIICLHGLIHSLGFIKGFGIKEVKELTMPISKPMGVLWLSAAILILIYGVLYFNQNKYAWLLGFLAVFLSQILIFIFWKDARFGTIPNLILLILSIISLGEFQFNKLIQTETKAIIAQNHFDDHRIVTSEDLQDLPAPVRTWLDHSGIIGQRFIALGKVVQEAELKMQIDQDNWMDAEAVQYTTIDTPAFIWTVNAKGNTFLKFVGRDKFVSGRGEMLIKLHSLVNVVNEKGSQLDEGSAQRYLGEMVWFPSLALSPYITWQEVDSHTAIAEFDYQGKKVNGTFTFNDKGDFVKFSTLRFMGNSPDAKRFEWVLSVLEYDTFNGIRVPSYMTATWKLDNKDWTWLKLRIIDIEYDNHIEG